MKKLLTLFYLGVSLSGCTQEVKKENIMREENVQKVANIYKEVKTYDYNPQYKLHISEAANFSYEILVNGFPVHKNYKSGIVTGSVPINEAILKKGKQTLTIKMTPPVDKQFNMGTEIDLSIVALKLSIEYGDHNVEKYKDFKTVLNYEILNKNEKLPYCELNLEFDAPEVPYENEVKGWADGVDLSKEDKHKLQEEVEDFYKEMIGYYETKNIDALAAKYYKSQKETAQAHFLNKKEDSQIVIDEWVKDLNDTRPFVWDKYTMKFYAGNKIVKLAKLDKYYIGLSTLFREDSEGNYVSYSMYLYRPKPGAPLEVIR